MDAELFEKSPFSIVASKESAGCWAGRPEIHDRLLKIYKSFKRRSDSSIDVVWANLGSGKSHLLLHFAHLLNEDDNDGKSSLVAYVEIPEDLKTFTDLFRRIMEQIDLQIVAQSINQKHTEYNNINRNLKYFAKTVIHGNSYERDLACDWIKCGRPLLRDLRNATTIDQRIENDTLSTTLMSDIIRILGLNDIRLILLFDEYQRIDYLTTKKRDAILSNLRTVFSQNPTHLSYVFAITSNIEKTAMKMIPEGLKTLIGVRPSITLPEMSEEEAYDFLINRLNYFRSSDYTGSDEAPFTKDTIKSVIILIKENTKVRMIPRTILQIFGLIYDELLDDPSLVENSNKLEELVGALLSHSAI